MPTVTLLFIGFSRQQRTESRQNLLNQVKLKRRSEISFAVGLTLLDRRFKSVLPNEQPPLQILILSKSLPRANFSKQEQKIFQTASFGAEIYPLITIEASSKQTVQLHRGLTMSPTNLTNKIVSCPYEFNSNHTLRLASILDILCSY